MPGRGGRHPAAPGHRPPYGIKSDTLFLDRETSKADILAFSYLYPLVNTNLLRRIEKPELPRSALRALRALREVDSRTAWPTSTSASEREDVIPQMAELSLQLEGAEWSGGQRLCGRQPRRLRPQRGIPEGGGDGA